MFLHTCDLTTLEVFSKAIDNVNRTTTIRIKLEVAANLGSLLFSFQQVPSHFCHRGYCMVKSSFSNTHASMSILQVVLHIHQCRDTHRHTELLYLNSSSITILHICSFPSLISLHQVAKWSTSMWCWFGVYLVENTKSMREELKVG